MAVYFEVFLIYKFILFRFNKPNAITERRHTLNRLNQSLQCECTSKLRDKEEKQVTTRTLSNFSPLDIFGQTAFKLRSYQQGQCEGNTTNSISNSFKKISATRCREKVSVYV
jgi:hypothetical protein